ncbi:autotransporter outer membrane beta-barrel domain-containing protein [Brucella sp. NM4]|uniref:autotransporter family protein n=1 Tax=Brucella/Ochrobactrum group TaxID=2826938 RepID=UPI0024BD3F9A|nr:autotransporter outer membrane beta-barrel domain-containing protein [Brucella sp. NM4]WHS30085.1 autotransporter outer membrane beta-barrel domain-containing protein [Brucella sp. NM4]WHT44431.1 autotransporter outer membrane beta-barrel domain-containing protein [Ochrobactrum sp. SSR]
MRDRNATVKRFESVKACALRLYPLLFSTTALVSLASPAASACISSIPGEYTCSGTETSPQTLGASGVNTSISFTTGASINASGALALDIRGLDVVYADQSDTVISGDTGLSILAGGAIDVTINGTLSGDQAALYTDSSSNGPVRIVNKGIINGKIISYGNTELILDSGSGGDYGGPPPPNTASTNIHLQGDNNSLIIKEGAILPSSYSFAGGGSQFTSTTNNNEIVFDGGTRDILSGFYDGFRNWDQVVLRNNADITFGDPNDQTSPLDPTSTYAMGYMLIDITGSEEKGLTIESGSTFRFSTDNYVVHGTTNNSGMINMADGRIDNLSIGGILQPNFNQPTLSNYHSNGGALTLDVVLGDSSSPADKFIVYGNVTGITSVYINNLGGVGALTTGNGIPVIQVVGDSSNGDFVLGHSVIAGAYEYNALVKGPGNALADGKGPASANDWYLRSILAPLEPEDPEPEAPTETPGGQPPVVNPPVTEAPQEPKYHPGAPLYETYPQTLQVLNALPTMQQRVGNRFWNEPSPPAETIYCKDASLNFRCPVTTAQSSYYLGNGGKSVVTANGVWGRIEASHGERAPAYSTTRSEYEYDLYKLQAGVDGMLFESEAGKVIGGINAYYGSINSDVKSRHGYGEIDTQGYGIGATLTWYGANGLYVDGQAQMSWFDTDIVSNSLGDLTLVDGNNGTGYAISAEIGKRFALNEDWALTPQAQLVYSRVDFDRFVDPFGSTVDLEDGDSLRGRVGLSLEKQRRWLDGEGKVSRLSLYGIGNVYNEFLGGTKVDLSGVDFRSRNERLWGGLGLGFTYNWSNDKYSLFGEVGSSTSFENFGDSYDVSASLGMKVSW